MNYLIPFIILITIVVFVHEYGHYYFAKRYGVGIILPIEIFPEFVSQSLLFLSFLIATFIPPIIWKLR